MSPNPTNFVIAAALLWAAPSLAQKQIVVLTPPAFQPYNLQNTDPPASDSFTIGTQSNGKPTNGVSLFMFSDAPWITFGAVCGSAGGTNVSTSSGATIDFCVDPTKTAGNGYYVGLIQVTAPLDSSYPILYVPINLTRFPTGDLSPDPANVTLSPGQPTAKVTISEDSNGQDAGGNPVTVTSQLGSPNPPLEGNWLQFKLVNGSISTRDPGEIDLQFIPANLTSQVPNSYIHTVVLTDTLGDTKAITVTLNVTAPVVGPASTVNAASFASNDNVAPDSIAAVFGVDLATQTASASGPLATSLGGSSATITDSSGSTQPAPLFFVSPGQINLQVPPDLASGPATVAVQSSDGVVSKGPINIVPVAPGLFAAGSLALGNVIQIVNGAQVYGLTFQVDNNNPGQLIPVPININSAGTYLVLYGTGIRGAALSQVSMQVGSTTIHPLFVGATEFAGEDQVNLQLPTSLSGSGDTTIVLTAGGMQTNPVHVTIQ